MNFRRMIFAAILVAIAPISKTVSKELIIDRAIIDIDNSQVNAEDFIIRPATTATTGSNNKIALLTQQ